MSREHLYKAKRVNWRELPKEEWWVEGDLIHEPYGTVIQYYEDEIKDKGNCAKTSKKKRIKAVVEPETVCEYTGLEDKNDRKIFENDICDRKEEFPEIVTYHDGDWTIDYSYASEKERGYKYCNLGFYVIERGGVEVIGNIFDNPELLEGGEAE